MVVTARVTTIVIVIIVVTVETITGNYPITGGNYGDNYPIPTSSYSSYSNYS